MKFVIKRTSSGWNQATQPHPAAHDAADRPSYAEDPEDYEHRWLIEVDSLDALLALVRHTDCKRVVVSTPADDLCCIEIYDAYRE